MVKSVKRRIVIVSLIVLVLFSSSLIYGVRTSLKTMSQETTQGVVISGNRIRYKYNNEIKEISVSDVGIGEDVKIGDNYGLYFVNGEIVKTYSRSTQDSFEKKIEVCENIMTGLIILYSIYICYEFTFIVINIKKKKKDELKDIDIDD